MFEIMFKIDFHKSAKMRNFVGMTFSKLSLLSNFVMSQMFLEFLMTLAMVRNDF